MTRKLPYTGYEYLLEYFEDYDYGRPKVPPEMLDYRNPENIVGHQQRCFLVYWALKATENVEKPVVIDVACGQAITPSWAIGVDKVHGIHPAYGGFYKPTVQALGEKLPFKDEVADAIVSNHGVEHLEDFPKVLRDEWLRVLKKGGIIAFVTPDRTYGSPPDLEGHTREWTPDEMFIECLLPLIEEGLIEILDFDSFNNHFSFNVCIRKLHGDE